MADDFFCEVCGDTGGALSLVLCENVEHGCPAGVHLYCCVPLRTELPTEDWYCSQCMAQRSQAALSRSKREAAPTAARKQRKRQRREAQQQQQQRAEPQKQQQQQQPAERQQQQSQQQEGVRQQDAPPPAGAHAPTGNGAAATPATPAAEPGVAMQPRRSGLAASLARSSSKALAPASRAAAAAAGAPRQPGAAGAARPAAGAAPAPPAAAHPVASSDVFSSLFASLQREDEASQEQRRQQGRVLDGTSRSMVRALAEREERRRAVAAQFALEACRGPGRLWQGSLCLPLAQEAGVWQAGGLECFGIPGNPLSGAAASHLVVLAREATAGRQHAPRLLSMDELGIRQDAAHEEAAFVLALSPADPAAVGQWAALWDVLHNQRQAVGIHLPAAAAAQAAAALRGGGGDIAGDAGGAAGLFLALVPNVLDRQSQSLLGLLAVPMQVLARAPAGGAPQRSCLRRPAPAGGAAFGSEPVQKRLRGVGWADDGREDKLTSPEAASLELAVGAHYATPQRRTVQATRPARLPSIHATVHSFTGGQASPPGHLAGLHVAVVGFDCRHENMRSLLGDLQALGASTYANKANLAHVLVVHPLLLQRGLDDSSCFPLGLSHMLATSGVHAYADSSLTVLYHLVRHKRRLHGAEWREAAWKPVFPDGLCVVLDAPALVAMQPAALASLLSHVRQLAAAAEAPHCVFAVAAPPADLAGLQAAATAGHAHAAENWRLWQAASGLARELGDREMEARPHPEGPPAVVQHALVMARNAAPWCRLVYLCSGSQEVLRHADARDTILCGSSEDCLGFLRARLDHRQRAQQRQQQAAGQRQAQQAQAQHMQQAQQAQQQQRPPLPQPQHP